MLEADRVDAHLGVREQPDDVVAQHDGIVATGGPPGEVGRLVEAGGGSVRRLVRPEQVHHLLAMEAMTGGEGEDLDERGGTAPRPAPGGGRHAVNGDAKAAEHRDLDGCGAALFVAILAMLLAALVTVHGFLRCRPSVRR